tara:strand:+ start:195 stop:437 length:243 start_codon:yes stop_codon:yes gene_type:complete
VKNIYYIRLTKNLKTMEKLNAKQLFDYLTELRKDNDLSNIQVNYRYSNDSDVYEVSIVEEDLFDQETNNKLESIVLKIKE